MKTKEELEAITCQVSKDLIKYNLTFPEMTVVLTWILSAVGLRVFQETHEFKIRDDGKRTQ